MAHILLVDDEDGVRKLASIMLSRSGHQVSQAEDGHKALDLINASKNEEIDPLDLMITDLSMPNMSGVELIEKAVELLPGMPIVVMTGDDEINDETKTALGTAKYAFLDKMKVTSGIAAAANDILE